MRRNKGLEEGFEMNYSSTTHAYHCPGLNESFLL